VVLRLDLNERISRKKQLFYARPKDYDAAKKTLASYCNISPIQLALTNGSFHALDLIFGSLLRAGTRVFIPVPTFPFYEKFEFSGHLKIEKVPCFDAMAVMKSLNRLSASVRAIYLANPNNPLGYGFTKTELGNILDKVPKTRLFVVDEAYYEFCGITAKSLISKHKNLIVVRTLSKAFGLAGARIGYVIANPQIIRRLERLKGPPYTINHFGLSLVAQLTSSDFHEAQNYANEINQVKIKLTEKLSAAGIDFYQGLTNFLAIKTFDAKKVTGRLEKLGILVNNLGNYTDSHRKLKNYIRLTIPPYSKLDWVSRSLLVSLVAK